MVLKNIETLNSKHNIYIYMGVSKNRGTPKWMVYDGKPFLEMDDLGENPLFLRNTHIYIYIYTPKDQLSKIFHDLSMQQPPRFANVSINLKPPKTGGSPLRRKKGLNY